MPAVRAMQAPRRGENLENTLATAVGDDDVVSVKAGGFQVGGGLRLKF